MTIRVLVADDHAMMREGLRALLSAIPDLAVVAVADNGLNAVELARKTAPDVAVLDIAMPDLNGIEAARRLRAACPSTHIVMLSMHGSSEHIYRALRAGATGYLLKESAGDELAAAIRAAHLGRRYLSRSIDAEAVAKALERADDSPLQALSPRERHVLQLVVEGHSNAEIARRAALSVKTVETYRSRMMQKLGIEDLPALVKFAVENGITPLS